MMNQMSFNKCAVKLFGLRYMYTFLIFNYEGIERHKERHKLSCIDHSEYMYLMYLFFDSTTITTNLL